MPTSELAVLTGTQKTERARLDWHVGLYSPMENDPRSIASENPNQGTTEVEPHPLQGAATTAIAEFLMLYPDANQRSRLLYN